MKKNILMTSIGAKVPFVKTLLDSKNKFDSSIVLYGSDTDTQALAQYFVDSFFLMQKIKNLTIENFLSLCEIKKIKYIIPSRDEDVLYFSKYNSILQENGIFLFAPDYEVAKLCSDKLHFANNIENKFLIPTSTTIETINAQRYVVKERFGSGSEKIGLNLSKEDALEFAKELKSPLYQPFISGKEYSIDSFISKTNKSIATIIRSRDLIINGQAEITSYFEDEKLKTMISNFAQQNKIYGHSVIQVIKNNQEYFIIECNTRFGGASTLSYAMGLESFYWFLLESNNLCISFKLNPKKLKQIRVPEDKYFEC